METYVLTDLLSGPDQPMHPIPAPVKSPVTRVPAAIQPSVTIYTDALSGNVDKTSGPAGGAGSSPGAATYTGTGMTGIGLGGGRSGGRHTTGGSVMAAPSGLGDTSVATSPCPEARDPAYYFCGSMSEDLLHRYLDRAIEMNEISGVYYPYPLPGTLLATPTGSMLETTSDHEAQRFMITAQGAKYAAHMIGYWGQTDYLPYGLLQFKADVDQIHSIDPDVICEADVYEIVYQSDHINSIAIPSYVYKDFGIDTERYHMSGVFSYDDIIYNTQPSGFYGNIDMSKPMAQWWCYYLATQYILKGAEAIYFSDVWQESLYDGPAGNPGLWKVVSKVRNFAKGISNYNTLNHISGPNARRGMVLCSAHVILEPQDGSPSQTIYFDPDPYHLAPPDQRQLIFDFHVLGLQAGVGPYFDPSIPPCDYPFNALLLRPDTYGWGDLTVGGLHPLGWICAHNACAVNTDHGATFYPYAGCAFYDQRPMPDPHAQDTDTWGYEPATWLLNQPSFWRDKIIPYFHYGIKCINPFLHFYMPGRLGCIDQDYPNGIVYTANEMGQEGTIGGIWSGVYIGPTDWVLHIFDYENVLDATYDGGLYDSLVFVGSNAIYYIGADGYIHGYIKVNGDYNDGTWLTVSPSYAASVPIGLQVKAQSDLVASPDGSKLLYIGVDGYIYGFNIVNVWSYQYLDFIKNDMSSSDTTATCCLIFTDNSNCIFYIGNSGAWVSVVQGYIIEDWATGRCTQNNPAYLDSLLHGYYCDSNCAAINSLAYESNTYRLYYVNANGLLAYYQTNMHYNYFNFVDCPGNYDLQHIFGITIQGNLAINYNVATNITNIYFVGKITGTDICYVFGLMTNGFGWAYLDPSYPYGSLLQSDSSGWVAVSPDGSTIAYWGNDLTTGFPVVVFLNFDGVSYTPKEYSTEIAASGNYAKCNSLQFTDNNGFYCINNFGLSVGGRYTYVAYLLHYKHQEAYCQNLAIIDYLA